MANVLNRINTASERVRRLLLEKEEYRDDDEALLVRFWWDELKAVGDPNNMTAKELLNRIKMGQLTAPDVINRARRKVQEEWVETRGKKYALRHKEQENVRKGINNK